MTLATAKCVYDTAPLGWEAVSDFSKLTLQICISWGADYKVHLNSLQQTEFSTTHLWVWCWRNDPPFHRWGCWSPVKWRYTQGPTRKDSRRFWPLVLCCYTTPASAYTPSRGGRRGAPIHTVSNTTAPWGWANWQHTLPGVRTNAKGTSKVESGRRKAWLRRQWQDIPGHENVTTKGNGGREHGAHWPQWKEERTGRYHRMVRFCVPPLGSNPEDVTILKHPTQLKLVEEKKWNGSNSEQMLAHTKKQLYRFSYAK